ncbi:MAG: peptidase U32 family protein [archaeon]
MFMKKVELLLPAGDDLCLRAAVNNGADAIYLGLDRFNARRPAGNFSEKNITSAIAYCHKRGVRAYIALNTIVKNSELNDYFRYIQIAYSAGADAIIIQDPCFIPLIKKNFTDLKIHLSTQAHTTNSYSIPKNIDRVVLARELTFDEVKDISKKYTTEIFVHGALCFSYSGQCLFSSIVGGRSGNRGLCAQPCRMQYNNKYPLSTMDLCLLPKIPELIKAGVTSLKVEGRMRSPVYVATAAMIYRKYIDSYYSGSFHIDEKDIDALKLAFNREFTTGFAFNPSVIDARKPMNRGLYIGTIHEGRLTLKKALKTGDGLGIWLKDEVIGHVVREIRKDGVSVKEAHPGDTIELDTKESYDKTPVYKTSSVDMKIDLGDEIAPVKPRMKHTPITLPTFSGIPNNSPPKIFAKAYTKKSAIALDSSKADIIYYDITRDDCAEVKGILKHSRFFVFTPRVQSDKETEETAEKIKALKPDGVLVGNRGLLRFLNGYGLHQDYSLNTFNDIDIAHYSAIPIISPELSLKELTALKNKNFIALVHGDIILMTSKEKLKAPELVDNDGRHFRVRLNGATSEILNSKQLGLFNRALDYLSLGIKYFYVDTEKDADKYVRIYRKILSGEPFDDSKIRKGYTRGHLERGVL